MSNLPTNDASPTSTLSDAEYDALAELFLGSQDQGEPPLRLHRQEESTPASPQALTPPPPVEALVLGHLPILAGPWVPQYARHLSETRHETIGLIRLHAGQCSLDIFSNQAAPISMGSHSHLSGAITHGTRHVDRWLVRVDATDEPTLATSHSLDELTLLSSTDDAAVVAAYQTIKRLDASHDPDDSPHVNIVFIGATPRESDEAGAKITRAVGAFLESNVSINHGPEKLGPTSASNLYRGDSPDSLDALLAMLTTPASPEDHAPTTTAPHVAPRNASKTPASSSPVAHAPREPIRSAPPVSETSTRLAVHIDGLRDLGVTCPYAPDVAIAFDTDARLHLLCAHNDSTFQSLQVTRAWAIDHATLLVTLAEALGIRTSAFDPDAPITLHVLTRSVQSVRRLLDTPVRFHLLADITVNNTQTQACIPLNS
ncbi:MAG: hypothetical protein ACF8GE_09290 [Phycisphaerales bacterium JB043]